MNKISDHKKSLINSIRHNNTHTKRTTPLEVVGNIANLLFGVCDATCVKKYDDHVTEIENLKVNLVMLEKQMKIVQIEKQTSLTHASIEKFQYLIEDGMKETKLNNIINNIFILITMLHSQYFFHTSTTSEIIQNTKLGIIHPGVIGPQELLKHFRDIEVALPRGTDLLVGLTLDKARRFKGKF